MPKKWHIECQNSANSYKVRHPHRSYTPGPLLTFYSARMLRRGTVRHGKNVLTYVKKSNRPTRILEDEKKNVIEVLHSMNCFWSQCKRIMLQYESVHTCICVPRYYDVYITLREA